MEETSSTAMPIEIQPRNVFGLRTDVIGNVQFSSKQEVIYPVEGALAFHNYVTNKQKFLRFPDKTAPAIINISPNRKLLAVVEIFNEKTHNISVYDLLTLKKRRFLHLPIAVETPKIETIAFTFDSKGLMVLSKAPAETLILFAFDKAETILQGRAANTNLRGTAQCLACNLNDPGLVAVGGDSLFKLMSRSEKGFGLTGNLKCENLHVTSMAWVSSEILIAGTSKGQLLFVEAGVLKVRYDAFNTNVIDLAQISDTEDGGVTESATSDGILHVAGTLPILPVNENQETRVFCLQSFSKGFAYAIFNTVYVFQQESKFRYERKTILRIPFNIYPREKYQIRNLAINSQEDSLVVTAEHSQIYVGQLVLPESLKCSKLELKMLGEPLHIDEIIDLAICSWKPIIMTAAKDQTIRIWNYETEKTELVKKFSVNVTAVALHPSGLVAAIGFVDQLMLVEILLDNLQTIKSFNFPRCSYAAFSNFGHMLAVAHENLVTIVSVFSFETIRILKGHNGMVLSVAWSKNDQFIVSTGIEGAVYQWSIESGARVHEVVQKGIENRSVVLSSDLSSTYVVTNHGVLRDIANSEITREIRPNSASVPLLAVTLSRSDLVMFVSSDQGQLYSVQLPLEAGGGTCTNYRFFHSAITKMRIVYDDTLLITVSRHGTLAVWVILNNAGKIAPLDQDLGKCMEILISRKSLIDKNETISLLKIRMQQQIEEFQYQLKQNDVTHLEDIKKIRKEYCDVIEGLKEKNDGLEKSYIEKLNVITSSISDGKEKQERQIQELESKFNEKITFEIENGQRTILLMQKMQEDYEKKLKDSEDSLKDITDMLKIDLKKQFNEREKFIIELKRDAEDKNLEFIEYCRQVDEDHDRELVAMQLHYKKQLKSKQDSVLEWRAQAGLLRQKNEQLIKESKDLSDEIDKLKNEHQRLLDVIENNGKDMDELRNEISYHSEAILGKEQRITEMIRENHDIEKHKFVLNHRIIELNAQIEPLEQENRIKRNEVAELESLLIKAQKKNQQNEFSIVDLNDKYRGSEIKLKEYRQNLRAAEKINVEICSQIYRISVDIQNPERLKAAVMRLIAKYCSNEDIKQNVEQLTEIESEFTRQRKQMEKLLAECNKKKENANRMEAAVNVKLKKDNVFLLDELNVLRKRLNVLKKQNADMQSLLEIGSKQKPLALARQKLENACANCGCKEQAHLEENESLQKIIRILTDDNQALRGAIANRNEEENMQLGPTY